MNGIQDSQRSTSALTASRLIGIKRESLICRKCKKISPLNNFRIIKWKDSRYYSGNCRDCVRVFNLKYRIENPERIKFLEKNRDKVKKRIKDKRNSERRRFGGNRLAVLERDHYQCQTCGKDAKTIHHIDGNGRGSKNPNNNINNLITTCQSCHVREHMIEIWRERKNGNSDKN